EELKGTHVEFVGGLEIGAVPLATAVAVLSQARGRPIAAFFVRKQAKEHGARKLVEGLAPGESLHGKHVGNLESGPNTRGPARRLVPARHRSGQGGRRRHRERDHRRGPAGGRRRDLQGPGDPLPRTAHRSGLLLILRSRRGPARKGRYSAACRSAGAAALTSA